MENIPENDITAENIPDTGIPEEDSTIFSAPAEHKPVKKKKTKIWQKIAAAAICLVFLAGGTYGVIRLIPKIVKDTGKGYAEEITVLNMDPDNISSVTLTNAAGTVKLYSDVEPLASGEGTATVWFVDGVERTLTSATDIRSSVYNAVSIKASREITEKSDEACGLDKPAVTAQIVPKEEDPFTVTVGKKSPDGSGYYMKLSSTGKKYIIPAEVRDGMEKSALDFADASVISEIKKTDDIAAYFTESSLTDFDKLTLTGENYKTPLTVINNKDDGYYPYIGYLTTAPTKRIANEDSVNNVMNLFKSGLSCTGAYSYKTDTAELAKFGLDKPDLTVSLDIKKLTRTYKFKRQSDGNYAVWCNESPYIHKVGTGVIEDYINSSAADYYSTWICYTAIDDISNFAVTAYGKEYSFGITKEESDEDNENKYTIVHNGKEMVALNFQRYYQYCVTLKCVDYEVSEITAKPDLVFDFTFKNGKKSKIEFARFDDTLYQYSVDGEPLGKIAATDITKLAKYASRLSAGETIDEIV